MKFQFTVVVDASDYKTAVASIPDGFEILSGGVKPEPMARPTSGLPSALTNMRTGQTVNG